MSPGCLVLVPLRSFADPKTRLADVQTPEERIGLARRLAGGVLDALDGRDVAVVTDDAEVAAWCAGRAEVIRPGVTGLGAAASAGVALAASRGIPLGAIVHADLATPASLGAVLDAATATPGVVTAVPDRHGDGTNVLVVPSSAGFVFHYGPGSFARHREESERLGLPFVSVAHDELGWDVDTPDDLAHYLAIEPPPPSP